METKSVWLCEEHYQEACQLAGYELPIMTIHNFFNSECEWCRKVANHFIDIDTNIMFRRDAIYPSDSEADARRNFFEKYEGY